MVRDIAAFTEVESRIPKEARLCRRDKELAVFKKHKYSVLWHKM